MASVPVQNLVLDATPLITQSATTIQQLAANFYTTPGVRAELKDEHSRNQLLLWGERLQVRQPRAESIDQVSQFARQTGDYTVMSMNDVHVIALAYEIEVETNGASHLRKHPGQVLAGQEEEEKQRASWKSKNFKPREYVTEEAENLGPDEDGFEVVGRKTKRKNHRFFSNSQKSETLTQQAEGPDSDIATSGSEALSEQTPDVVEEIQESVEEENGEQSQNEENLDGDSESGVYNEEDDDGDWITPENLQQELLKDSHESVQDQTEEQVIAVAFATGDFACQNTAMQIGLKLMNYVTGKQIQKVRNYMYRCHACFSMFPMPKDGRVRHFCPKCGGNTLLRCAVSVDKITGKVTPHLKKNFQWITRGHVYSVASPLSKNSKKAAGNRGHQHAKESTEPILRADQKEYYKAVKDNEWQRKKSEKMMREWVSGGSADNLISPFGTTYKAGGVKVGRGRNANALKKKK